MKRKHSNSNQSVSHVNMWNGFFRCISIKFSICRWNSVIYFKLFRCFYFDLLELKKLWSWFDYLFTFFWSKMSLIYRTIGMFEFNFIQINMCYVFFLWLVLSMIKFYRRMKLHLYRRCLIRPFIVCSRYKAFKIPHKFPTGNRAQSFTWLYHRVT